MIQREEFAKVMGVFADRIGRALTPVTYDVYYDLLSEQLTTEEFLAGARVVFRSHAFNTWPAPQQFIDAVKPQASSELAAGEAFEAVMKAVGSVYEADGRRERIALLGPIAERAYRAAGGARDFLNVLEKDLPYLRRRFVECYADATSEESRRADAMTALNRGALNSVAALVADVAKQKALPRPAKVLPMTTREGGADKQLPTGDR